MREELVSFVLENKLSPFDESKINLRQKTENIFKTRDAKSIYARVLNQISGNFSFTQTSTLWGFFELTQTEEELRKRQEFFSSLKRKESFFLKKLKIPRKTWKPRYDVVVVTEEESTFVKLKELNCPCIYLVSENDVADLERYDIVQVVDCDTFKILLERLPQTIFLSSIEDVYLERYLEELSGWRENYEILKENESELSEEIKILLARMADCFYLMKSDKSSDLSEEKARRIVEDINEKISEKIKEMTISGEGLLKMLGEGKMPQDILSIVRQAIEESKVSEHLFNIQIPVTIDQRELEEQIRRQSINEFSDLAQEIKRNANKLKEIPLTLSYLEADLLVEDFCMGVSLWMSEDYMGRSFPQPSDFFEMIDSKNLFLNNAQPISFQLTSKNRCSILTGANSGGKTTLIEHIIQNIALHQTGLPIRGKFVCPLFTEVYYFAKNKGSASKGAFENLLSQMSKIKVGPKTLILADEIEAVTEPGVAGKIICATADYFILKECFLVLATHLGHEIKKSLPRGARIDGIEAKGLDENFELMVDHNPVLGRLAHSTPELIVERMAQIKKEDYFKYVYEFLKR